jgi:hypothetical protein
MPKPPLSPFLLDPTAEPMPDEDRRTGSAATARGAMDLDSAELFVLATLRAWVAPRMRPEEPYPDWRELFRLAAVGAPGSAAFDTLMSIIGGRAKRLLDVHCCRCPRLGEDETAMLRLLAALQSGDPFAALEILGSWLPGEAIGPALRAAQSFADTIAEAGLVLPRPGRMIGFPGAGTLH